MFILRFVFRNWPTRMICWSLGSLLQLLWVLDVTFWSFACAEGEKNVRLREINRLMHFSQEKAVIKNRDIWGIPTEFWLSCGRFCQNCVVAIKKEKGKKLNQAHTHSKQCHNENIRFLKDPAWSRKSYIQQKNKSKNQTRRWEIIMLVPRSPD